MTTLFSQSTQLFQQYLVHEFHHRKLLLNTTLSHPPVAATPLPSNSTLHSLHQYKFDATIALVLVVLLGALICSLGLKPIMRCAFTCLNLANANSADPLANTRVKKKALRNFPTMDYSPDQKLGTECVICLSEFVDGEVVRILPNCSHGFHVVCIDTWLSSHSTCPTCRHCLLENYKKITSNNNQAEASSSEPVSAVQQGLVRPLEREGAVSNSRGSWKNFDYMARV